MIGITSTAKGKGLNKSPKTALSPTFQPPHLPSPIGIPRSSHLSPETNIKIQNQFIYSNLKEYRCKPQNSPVWLVQGAAIYINIAAPCTTEIHIENQHLTLLVKPRVQPRFLHHLLILCFSCNPVIPKNKKSPKHFPFSVKIPIFASVPRAERSNAAKPAQLPNRYRLPNFLLFKSYLPTDYKKTIVFLKKTTDLLYNVAIPSASGYDSMLKNIGSVQNKGYELSIESDNLSGAFSWTTAFNISFNRNKVLELGGETYKDVGTYDDHLKTSDIRRLIVGQPIGVFYGYRFDGIFQNEAECAQQTSSPSPIGVGLRRYKDLNGDGKIDATNDREILGDANPKFFGGMTNTFAYRGFELNVFLQYSYGNKIFNYNAMELESPTGGQNVYQDLVNRWTPTNPSNEYQKATTNRNNIVSDRFIEDGSFLKLKTVSLSYSFPKLNWKHIGGLRLYVTGQNLLTWTKYRGYDPEVSYRGASTLEAGEDFGGYPQARTFMFGIKLDIK